MRLHLSLFSMNRWIDWYQQGKSDLQRAWLDLEQEEMSGLVLPRNRLPRSGSKPWDCDQE